MPHQQIEIPTADGLCPVHVLTPDGADHGAGPWPAVIFYMDGLGMRQTLIDMAQRLADNGYLVLLPDMYYRWGAYAPMVPAEVFKGDFRTLIGPMMATTGNAPAAQDTAAFLAWLGTNPHVAGTKVGTVGFCMGGGMAITAAGTYPDRVAAAASFHGGRLATDEPTSPHLLSGQIKAELLIAGADNDASYPLDMAERLTAALTEAGVRFHAEIYPGAAHGWMKKDFPVYDEAAAERGWAEMLSLFARNLHQ
jgi:carboxymethylenebutenolidase